MTQEAGIDKVQLGCFYNAFAQIVGIRLQKMNDERGLQNRQPCFDRRCGYADISCNAVHRKKLPAVQGADLNKFLEGGKIVGVYLISDIQIQIGVNVTFIPVLRDKVLI